MPPFDDLPIIFQLALRLFLLIEVITLSHLSGRLFLSWILGFKPIEIKLGVGSKYLFRSRKWGMELAVTSLPMGGRVKYNDEDSSDNELSTNRLFVLKKICLLLFGPIGNFIAAIIMLAVSLSLFGDSDYTMQVVNISKNSPAEKVVIMRGDIVRSVNGYKITKFEKGRQMISSNPNSQITLGIERKSDYLKFNDYKGLLDYLDKLYKPSDYIRIFDSAHLPKIFYAKEPALSYLETINLNNLRVEISTASKFFDLTVTPDSLGKIGIGIKPYSLPNSMTYPNPFQSLTLSLNYTGLIMASLIDEIGTFVTDLFVEGNFFLEVYLISEMFQFVLDFSNFNASLTLKYLSMLCLMAGLLNLIPFPHSVGYCIVAIVGRNLVNKICKILFKLDGDFVTDDVENYLGLIYRGVLGLVLLLIIAHSFPDFSRLF